MNDLMNAKTFFTETDKLLTKLIISSIISMLKSKLLINDSQKIMSREKYIMFVIPMQAKSSEMKVIHSFRIKNFMCAFQIKYC